tara:strand:+ start:868 stop:1203 length:336 start_codon:yes stop_codon:yes gene_type:complete
MLDEILADAEQVLLEELDKITDEDPEANLSREAEDLVHELADNHVPIYYVDIVECARSNINLATTTPELWSETNDVTAANLISMNIYEELTSHLHGVLDKYIDKQEEKLNE